MIGSSGTGNWGTGSGGTGSGFVGTGTLVGCGADIMVVLLCSRGGGIGPVGVGGSFTGIGILPPGIGFVPTGAKLYPTVLPGVGLGR